MAAGVVPLDMEEVCRRPEGGDLPVEVAHPLVQGWVAGADVADVAFEMLDVDGLFSLRVRSVVEEEGIWGSLWDG